MNLKFITRTESCSQVTVLLTTHRGFCHSASVALNDKEPAAAEQDISGKARSSTILLHTRDLPDVNE